MFIFLSLDLVKIKPGPHLLRGKLSCLYIVQKTLLSYGANLFLKLCILLCTGMCTVHYYTFCTVWWVWSVPPPHFSFLQPFQLLHFNLHIGNLSYLYRSGLTWTVSSCSGAGTSRSTSRWRPWRLWRPWTRPPTTSPWSCASGPRPRTCSMTHSFTSWTEWPMR